MKITKEWLEQKSACEEGKQWFLSQKASSIELVIDKLIKETKFNWANWTITRSMTHEQNIRYACFSSLQSLQNFEKVYPSDKRPRLAIVAALKYAGNPTKENKSAESAARSAESAAWKKFFYLALNLF
jgi:hypothetical protein